MRTARLPARFERPPPGPAGWTAVRHRPRRGRGRPGSEPSRRGGPGVLRL